MTKTTELHSPNLAPPGAGLPFIELWIVRLWFFRNAHRFDRAVCEKGFAAERARIIELAHSVGPQKGRKQILIKRLRGIEDSSRFWSVFMTIEHLCIVNRGIIGIIQTLAAGGQPGKAVSTAAVKPSPSADVAIIDQFEILCSDFEKQISTIKDLNTSLKWPHPWFGPLNAAEWHFMAGMHMRLHRHQIEKIIENLQDH